MHNDDFQTFITLFIDKRICDLYDIYAEEYPMYNEQFELMEE